MSDPVRVVVADDQALVRSGLRAILESAGGIDVVGEAADGLEAVAIADREHPDVVLLDVQMPVMDGLQAARRLLSGQRPPRVVMLTTFDLDEYVYEAMRAGASGFLLKDTPREQLVAAVRTVSAGDALLSSATTRRLLARFLPVSRGGPSAPEATGLTDRELDVLRAMTRGLSNAEIAGELVLSETTVKTHVVHILAKLGVRDRVQAVIAAYERGVVVPGGVT